MRERNSGRRVKVQMRGGFQDMKAGVQDLNAPCVPIDIGGRQHQVHGKYEAHPPPAEDFLSGVSMIRPQDRSVPVTLEVVARVSVQEFLNVLARYFDSLELNLCRFPNAQLSKAPVQMRE